MDWPFKFLFALEALGTMQQICEFGDWEAVFQDEECLMRFNWLKIFGNSVENFDFCL